MVTVGGDIFFVFFNVTWLDIYKIDVCMYKLVIVTHKKKGEKKYTIRGRILLNLTLWKNGKKSI